MKIFIDFDDAIFNTKAFKNDLIDIFKNNGVTDKQFHESYKAYNTVRHGGISKYDPAKQIETLEKNLKIDGKKTKRDLDKLLGGTSKYVFRDVKPFLEKIGKEKLNLISFGDIRFQKMKMKSTGLQKYFRKVKITDKIKAEDIVEMCGKNRKLKFIFIDDRVDQIDPVKKIFPNCVTILIKRKEGRYKDCRTKHVDYEVKNLQEAEKILKRFKVWDSRVIKA